MTKGPIPEEYIRVVNIHGTHHQFSSVQSLSRVRLFATPWIVAHQASLSITNSQSSLRLTSIKSMMPSGHLILYRPLLLLPPVPPSIRVFSNESTLGMRWPKYWSFSLSIIPSKEIPGLISFRMDWLDLLAVQGTLKSLLQHHTSKASILQRSAFFTVRLSHPYMTTGKTIALSSNSEEAEVERFYEDLQDLLELTPKKRCPFHYRGLECKSRKSRNTWSNRQIWPWNTEWSRAKTNRVLPRKCTGHSKHPLPTTQEKTLHMDITRWSTPKSDW